MPLKSSKKKKEESHIGDTYPPIKDPIPPCWIPPQLGIGEKVNLKNMYSFFNKKFDIEIPDQSLDRFFFK